MAKETTPKAIHTKAELASLDELRVVDEEAKGRRKGQEAETKANEKEADAFRKSVSAKAEDEKDPVRRRELRRGK